MTKARHPAPYKDGRRQITVQWKRRVLAKLDENKRLKKSPQNIDQLMAVVGAKKGGLNATLDLERDPPQLVSAYETEVTEALGIEPPLLEADGDDDEFIRDVSDLRELPLEDRRDLMRTARRIVELRKRK